MTDATPLKRRQLQTYKDEPTCTRCGGQCCKRMPGITLPGDWGAPKRTEMHERLGAAFRSGDWAIDFWIGDPRHENETPSSLDIFLRKLDREQPLERVRWLSRVLFVRPHTLEGQAHGALLDPSWGGQCALLGDAGCSLPEDGRPAMCRQLVPNPKVGRDEDPRRPVACRQRLTKKSVAIAWIPYQDLVEDFLGQER